MENKTISIIGERCCGCTVCAEKCPKKAIVFQVSNEGFLYPTIDESKCTNCGMCLKVCPINSPIVNAREAQVGYATWVRDEEVLLRSSSGGLFYPLAELIISQNGYVCGCINDERCLPMHIISNKLDDVLKMQGSKYVESFLGNIFSQVKEKLDSGVQVLFTGTPCQIAGLRKYLCVSYDGLICVDLICHGVPSRLLFQEYLQWQEKRYGGKVEAYHFRSKNKHDWSLTYRMKIVKGKKMKIVEHMASLDPYYYGFLQGMTYRESCYHCPYSCLERIGDITIGDFWGIEKVDPQLNNSGGVSAVIINTSKGEMLFRQIKDLLAYQEISVLDIQKHNGNLISPTKRPEKRSGIYSRLNEAGFKMIAKQELRHNKCFIEWIKDCIPNRVRQKIKRIIRR